MISTPSNSSVHSSKKKASSMRSLRGLVATVAIFFVFAPVALAVCAPNSISIKTPPKAVAFATSDLSQNRGVNLPSKTSGLRTHCVPLDLLQLSDGILPSQTNLSQTSWNPVLWEALNLSFKNTPLHTFILDLSDSYRYKPSTLFDQRVLLRV